MTKTEKDYAVEVARKAGHARAQKLTVEERKQSARKAAKARWKKAKTTRG